MAALRWAGVAVIPVFAWAAVALTGGLGAALAAGGGSAGAVALLQGALPALAAGVASFLAAALAPSRPMLAGVWGFTLPVALLAAGAAPDVAAGRFERLLDLWGALAGGGAGLALARRELAGRG
jgi:hypothetical protein